MNVLKYHVRKLLGLPVHYYFKRATVPASTHLPVLIGLSQFFPIKSVLEFGAGNFSTLSFLDRRLFPHVERVLSFETDPEWKRRIEGQVHTDRRLTIELIDPDVPRTAAKCDYAAFDLVFVDNGPARAETIKEVVRHENDWKLVLIHDFENLPYKRAAEGASNTFCFDAYCPHTAVLWNERKTRKGLRATFRRMNKVFSEHVKFVEAGDTEQWIKIVAKLPPSLQLRS